MHFYVIFDVMKFYILLMTFASPQTQENRAAQCCNEIYPLGDKGGEARSGAGALIILSDVGVKQNPATRRTTQSRFFNLGFFVAHCLVDRKEISGSIADVTYGLGKKRGATTPKAGDAHGNM